MHARLDPVSFYDGEHTVGGGGEGAAADIEGDEREAHVSLSGSDAAEKGLSQSGELAQLAPIRAAVPTVAGIGM